MFEAGFGLIAWVNNRLFWVGSSAASFLWGSLPLIPGLRARLTCEQRSNMLSREVKFGFIFIHAYGSPPQETVYLFVNHWLSWYWFSMSLPSGHAPDFHVPTHMWNGGGNPAACQVWGCHDGQRAGTTCSSTTSSSKICLYRCWNSDWFLACTVQPSSLLTSIGDGWEHKLLDGLSSTLSGPPTSSEHNYGSLICPDEFEHPFAI